MHNALRAAERAADGHACILAPSHTLIQMVATDPLSGSQFYRPGGKCEGTLRRRAATRRASARPACAQEMVVVRGPQLRGHLAGDGPLIGWRRRDRTTLWATSRPAAPLTCREGSSGVRGEDSSEHPDPGRRGSGPVEDHAHRRQLRMTLAPQDVGDDLHLPLRKV